MKTNLIRVFSALAIGMIAVCASAIPAAAQDAVKGSFTLPSDVRWQGAALPAGDYTFSMKSAAVPATVIIRGETGAAIVMTAATSDRPAGAQSFLIVERRGNTRFVREMYLAELGVHLRYAAPAASKEKELAQGPVSTEQVLVAMNSTTPKYAHK
jgi:hypothetical protein